MLRRQQSGRGRIAQHRHLGVRGGQIHSVEEFVILDSLVERARLSALALMRMAAGEFDWPARRQEPGLEAVAMMIIRPVREIDLDRLLDLAGGYRRRHDVAAGGRGFPDRADLRFAGQLRPVRPGNRHDGNLLSGDGGCGQRDLVVGTSAIYAGVGYERPFYSYKVSTLVQSSGRTGRHLDPPDPLSGQRLYRLRPKWARCIWRPTGAAAATDACCRGRATC